MLVTLSGYIVNYLVTPASIHDSKACEELLEDTHFPVILADLGYLSQSLKQRLSQKRLSPLDTVTSKYEWSEPS